LQGSNDTRNRREKLPRELHRIDHLSAGPRASRRCLRRVGAKTPPRLVFDADAPGFCPSGRPPSRSRTLSDEGSTSQLTPIARVSGHDLCQASAGSKINLGGAWEVPPGQASWRAG
jgi:hypothetical protein